MVVPPVPPARGPWKRVALVALITVFVLGAWVSGFVVGQSTRKSDGQVAREQAVAVRTAVAREVSSAVTRKGAEDHEKRLRIMTRAEKRLKAQNRTMIRRVVRKLKRSADRKSAAAFASGSSAGYTRGVGQGYANGVDDGITKASDDLTCSDDPDVPLPYCS